MKKIYERALKLYDSVSTVPRVTAAPFAKYLMDKLEISDAENLGIGGRSPWIWQLSDYDVAMWPVSFEGRWQVDWIVVVMHSSDRHAVYVRDDFNGRRHFELFSNVAEEDETLIRLMV